jgi:3-dehydroquinate synthase
MHTVDVALGQRSYQILVGSGLLAEAGCHVAALFPPGRALIITDDTVAGLYLDRVTKSLSAAGFAVSTATVPAGEQSKSFDQLSRLCDECFCAGLERRSLILALGGGVIGDLAGFVAATYHRGIPFVQLPTTLLAQVDSSIGGKTAINLPGGKNLVGAFYQPALVLADIAALATLDARQFSSGLAEVVKHAMIRDAALFARLEADAAKILARDPATLGEIVARNCAVKAAVVSADEREAGLRAILNYGHTVGHAVEAIASYGVYTHGEAVALGMAAAAAIACSRGFISDAVVAQQNKLLGRFGLPTKLRRPLDADALLEAMRHDKKVRAGRLRLVLPVAIGETRIVDDVTDDELCAALAVM